MFFIEPKAGRLEAKNLDGSIIEEWMKQANRVRAAADSGKEPVGQTAFGFLHLHAGFIADDTLESRNMAGVRYWPRLRR